MKKNPVKMTKNCEHQGFAGLNDQVYLLIRRLRSIMYPEIFDECPCVATTVIENSVEADELLKDLIPVSYTH